MKKLFDKKNAQEPIDTFLLKNVITNNWTSENGVKVTFEKKGGTIREMIVKLNEELLQPKNPDDPRTQARRETNKANANMVVTEYLPESKSFQVRTIPLNKVILIETC